MKLSTEHLLAHSAMQDARELRGEPRGIDADQAKKVCVGEEFFLAYRRKWFEKRLRERSNLNSSIAKGQAQGYRALQEDFLANGGTQSPDDMDSAIQRYGVTWDDLPESVKLDDEAFLLYLKTLLLIS